MASQHLHAQAGWTEHVVPPCLQAAAEELVAHSQPDSKIKDYFVVRPRLTARRNHALTKLNELLRLRRDLETDTQTFPLPRRVNRKQDVRITGTGRLE
ncbi:hypothetical protein D9M68_903010 [compost metagenome]